MIEQVSLAGIASAVVIILWQTGIGTLVKRLLFSVSFSIPSASKRQAEMDLKCADEENPMTIREAIAQRRTDPAYDAAYKKIRSRK